MKLVVVTAIAVCGASSVFAGGVGSLGFADIGSPSVVGGDIDTGTQFTIGNLVSTAAGTNDFAGLSTQTFGNISFDVNVANSFSISTAAFGTFTSTSFQVSSSGPGFENIYILGNYTGGTYAIADGGPASFTLSFTQNPKATGAISDSGTFAIPPAAPPSSVPEPSTFTLLGLGGLGLTAFALRRRPVAF